MLEENKSVKKLSLIKKSLYILLKEDCRRNMVLKKKKTFIRYETNI